MDEGTKRKMPYSTSSNTSTTKKLSFSKKADEPNEKAAAQRQLPASSAHGNNSH